MGNPASREWHVHYGAEIGQLVVAKCCSYDSVPGKTAYGTSASTAYLPNLYGMSDEHFLHHWSQWRPPLPEYESASETICVSHRYMSHTLLLDSVGKLMVICSEELQVIRTGGYRLFLTASLGLIDYAYSLNGDVARCQYHKDSFTSAPIQHHLQKVFMALEDWKKPLFTLCLLALPYLATPDVCALKLSAIAERGSACPQVQVTSFSFLVLLCAEIMFRKSTDANTVTSAWQTFERCLEHWIDAYKEQALASAFTQPARFYWATTAGRPECPHWLEDNVEAHALNWYVAMVGSTLSVQLPHLPVFWDRFAPPVVDFWEGLTEEAWNIFSCPDNFGKSWKSIPTLTRSLVANPKLLGGHLPWQCPSGKTYALGAAMDVELSKGASHFANEAVNPSSTAQIKRRLLSRYLERFAHFFSAPLFVRRCFEALHAEQRPELLGAASAMKELFAQYSLEKDISESMVEHCYKDDMYLELDLQATSKFLQWLGVLKSDS